MKCPFSFRNDVLSETLQNTRKYIIFYDENKQVVINKMDHYHDQIQGITTFNEMKNSLSSFWCLKDYYYNKY